MAYRLPEINAWYDDPDWVALSPQRKYRVLDNYFNSEIADDEYASLDPQRQARIKNNFINDHLVLDKAQGWSPSDLPPESQPDISGEFSLAEPQQQEQPPVNGNGQQQQQMTEPQMVGQFVQEATANDPILASIDAEFGDEAVEPEPVEMVQPEPQPAPEPQAEPEIKPVKSELKADEKSFAERVKNEFTGGLEDVKLDLKGFDLAAKRAAGIDVSDELEAWKEARKKRNEQIPEETDDNLITKAALGAVRMSGPMAEGTLEGLMLGGITAAAGQAGPQVLTPEEIITVPLAVAVGAGQYWYRQGFGEIYGSLLEKNVNPDIAAKVATIAAPIYAYIEFSQVGKIAPGLEKVIKRKATDTVAKIVAKAAGKYATDVATETGEEVLQEAVQAAGEEVGKTINNATEGTRLKHTPIKQLWDRLWRTAKETVGPMMFLLGPKRVVSTYQEANARKELESQVAKLTGDQRKAIGLTDDKLKKDFNIDVREAPSKKESAEQQKPIESEAQKSEQQKTEAELDKQQEKETPEEELPKDIDEKISKIAEMFPEDEPAAKEEEVSTAVAVREPAGEKKIEQPTTETTPKEIVAQEPPEAVTPTEAIPLPPAKEPAATEPIALPPVKEQPSEAVPSEEVAAEEVVSPEVSVTKTANEGEFTYPVEKTDVGFKPFVISETKDTRVTVETAQDMDGNPVEQFLKIKTPDGAAISVYGYNADGSLAYDIEGDLSQLKEWGFDERTFTIDENRVAEKIRDLGKDVKMPKQLQGLVEKPQGQEPVSIPEAAPKAKPAAEPILSKSGRPYKTEAAAKRRANALGPDYKVVPIKGGFAVQESVAEKPANTAEPKMISNDTKTGTVVNKLSDKIHDSLSGLLRQELGLSSRDAIPKEERGRLRSEARAIAENIAQEYEAQGQRKGLWLSQRLRDQGKHVGWLWEQRESIRGQSAQPKEEVSITPTQEKNVSMAERPTGKIFLAGNNDRPFSTKKAAQNYAKRKGANYEAVPYNGKWAVREIPPETTPAKELTAEEKAKIEKELDKIERERRPLEVKKRPENTGMSVEGPVSDEPQADLGGVQFKLKSRFHGSPYEFDQFVTDRMGTGEGAQAFGWGLYFTDKEQIAKAYATPKQRNLYVGSVPINGILGMYRTKIQNFYDSMLAGTPNLELKQELLKDIDEEISLAKQRIVTDTEAKLRTELAMDKVELKRFQDLRKALVSRAAINKGRNLYKVSIGQEGQQEQWLDWYEPVPEEQLKAVEKVVDRTVPTGGTGGDLYKWLGGGKEASKLLSKAGFIGNRYPTETLSGKGTKGRTEFNYVVFDPKDIEIEDRTQFRSQSIAPSFTGPAMGALKVEQTLDASGMRKKLNLPIKVIGSVEDITDVKIRAAAERALRNGQVVTAYFDPGSKEEGRSPQIVILGDSIQTPDELIKTILPHEISHYGIAGVLGEKEYERFLQDLARDKYIGKEIKALMEENKWDSKYAASEWFAGKGEGVNFESLPKSHLQRLIALIKKYLRKALNWIEEKKGKRIATINFSDAEIKDLLRKSYEYATQAPAQEAMSGNKIPTAFRVRSLNDVLAQLKQVYKALDELPETRNGLPTTAMRQRLEAKAKELEGQVAEHGGGVRFHTRKPEAPRLKKALDALEKSLPEKGKDELRKKHTSTLIREQIKAIKQGHRLGGLDKKESLKQIGDFVLNYAAKYLPRTGMTRGQVRPLLTAVARAETADDMLKAYNRIDAISRTVTEKSLESDIRKKLKQYKPKKKDGKLSEKRITPEASTHLASIRNVIDMPQSEATEKLAKLASTHSGEYNQPDGDIPRPAQDLFDPENSADETAAYLIARFSDLSHRTMEELKSIKDEIDNIIKTGRTLKKEREEARLKKLRETRGKFVDIITKGKGVLNEDVYRALNPKDKDWKDSWWYEWHLSSLGLKSYLDIISGSSKKERAFHGFIIKNIQPLIHESQRLEKDGKEKMYSLIKDKQMEIYGARTAKQLEKMTRDNAKRVDTGAKITVNDKTVPLIMSQNEAYKRWMEWQRPNTAEAFKKMGYTQETIDALWDFMTPEIRKWAEWQLYEFNPMYYKSINEVFRKVSGVDLPYEPFYTEIIRDRDEDIKDDYLMSSGTNFVASVYSNRLKATTRNSIPLKLVDGDRMLVKRVAEMEHFKAWAENMKDIRFLLGGDVQRAIAQNYGRTLLGKMNFVINNIARGAIDPLLVDRKLNRVRGNINGALLGMNVSLLPKQASSILAYGMVIPINDFNANLRRFWQNPAKHAAEIMDTSYFKHRYALGYDRDMIINLMHSAANRPLSALESYKRKQYIFGILGDKASVILGGWPVYKYYYDLAKEGGATHAEARKKAIEEFESASNETQQSGEISDLPEMMQRGSGWQFFTMFMTQKNIYYQKEMGALRNLLNKRGDAKENLKIFAMAHILLPMWWQFVGNGFRWDPWDELRAAILGSLNGYMVFGSIVEAMADRMFGTPFKIFSNPLIDNAETAAKTIVDVLNYATSKEYSIDETLKLSNKILESLSVITGISYKNVARQVRNSLKFAKAPSPGTMMVNLGYTPYSLGLTQKRKATLDAVEEFYERPRAEQTDREKKQLEAEVAEYNKMAPTFDLPLIKENALKKAKTDPGTESLKIFISSSQRVLSDNTVKRFKRKLKAALEGGYITQKIYDARKKSFEQNQKVQQTIAKSYYNQGLEAPRRSKRSSKPRTSYR